MRIIKKMFYKIYIMFISNNKYVDFLRQQGVKIGKDCYIEKNVVFGSEPYLISIGNNVRLTNNVQFFNHDGSVWVLRNLGKVSKSADMIGKIKIGNNVNIGWNVMIMPNVVIGDNVIIGAGAIVTKDIPSNSVAVGVPARVIETIDEYYEKNKNNFLNTKNMTKTEKKEFLKKI